MLACVYADDFAWAALCILRRNRLITMSYQASMKNLFRKEQNTSPQFTRETGESFEFKCKPDHGVLRKKLNELFDDRYKIHLCYEACYVGYPLCRFLRKAAIHCDVIAPSLIPVKAGVRVKTDRLDALKLAEYYAKDLLTSVYVPDETYE